VLAQNGHLFGNCKVIIPGVLPVHQPDGFVMFANLRPHLHAVAQQAIHIPVGIVEAAAAVHFARFAELLQHLFDHRLAVPLALQPGAQQVGLNVAVVGATFPVAQVAVAQFLLEKLDHAVLGEALNLANGDHGHHPSIK